MLVVGGGKASARMAEAVEAAWGPCEGLVVTRYGHARPCRGIEIVEAAHPVPDEAGVAATRRMLDLVSRAGEDDLVLALISGGGSALLCAPGRGLTLEDKQALVRGTARQRRAYRRNQHGAQAAERASRAAGSPPPPFRPGRSR